MSDARAWGLREGGGPRGFKGSRGVREGSGEQGLGGRGWERVTSLPLPWSACTAAFIFLCEGGIGTWLGGDG